MEVWEVSTLFLIIVIFCLIVKIHYLQLSAKEITEGIKEKLEIDTNTLICISSKDHFMRELAEELNQQLRILRIQQLKYQNGDRELKEAITNISHDLRTPLTAICGYMDLLEELCEKQVTELDKEGYRYEGIFNEEWCCEKRTGNINLKQETNHFQMCGIFSDKNIENINEIFRYISLVRNRTNALKQLTEELFQYSMILSAKSDIVLEDVFVNQVLEESILEFYNALTEYGITPIITITEKTIHRQLNKIALSRIFSNLLQNALKYSDGDLEIELKDTGEIIFSNTTSTIDEVQVGRLFDRFFTVEIARNSTGLGLSIAKTLTEQMGGTISAQIIRGKLCVHLEFL